MSGLLALLDDVAGIAKVAAANVDDIAGQAAKASAKAAGAVIDDAAVTPKYVHGFAPARELPIVGKIALGSIRNKLVILLPLALLLASFAPWLITPLLMLGGSYLCFEGAEKVYHLFKPHAPHADGHMSEEGDPTHLEEQKIAGAVKTDFILSAEIMTIILAALDADQSIWFQAGALGLAGIIITVVVYGSVALIVKADDFGLWLARVGQLSVTRALGRGIVKFMPALMKLLMIVGTAAMIWVGGSIVIHGLHELGMHHPYEEIHHVAELATEAVAHSVADAASFAGWFVTAFFDGIFGLIYGLILIPVVGKIINPLIRAVRGKSSSAH
jgi:predicted DNA repair protein MutK